MIYYSPMQTLLLPLIISLLLTLGGCSKPEPPTINLFRAVHVEDIDQVERNLYWEAETDELGPDGLAPLHVAARLGSMIIIEMLLEYGADMEIKDLNGQTPVAAAVLSGNTLVADYLVDQGAQVEVDALLHLSIREGRADRDVVDFLIAKGADVNLADAQGNAPLHTAIVNGRRVMAKYLVQKGADVNLPNRSGKLPLLIAEESGEQDILAMLEKFGATRIQQ
jgi:ankyrin repeat protein